MYKYIPFEHDSLGSGNIVDIGTAYPGHLLGIYFRFYAPSEGLYPSWCYLSISDIGAMKNYILPLTVSSMFMINSQGFVLSKWMNPCFVPIDHFVETNHRVLLESRVTGTENAKVKGLFIYEK